MSFVMKLSSLLRSVLMASAFGLALLPSVLKMYETSHWYREGDPSVYDNAKDWFDNPALPFQKQVDDPKTMMRIYFFILPYIGMAAALALAHLFPKVDARKKEMISSKPRSWLIGRSFLLRTIPIPKFLVRLGAPNHVSVGEILGMAVFLFLNLGTIVVRIRRSLPRGSRKNLFLVLDGDAGKQDIDPLSWEAAEVWAKTLGVISILNLGWYLLMPIGRKSVLLEAVGLSWDRAIKYHRWVGYYSVAIMFVHGMMYILVLSYGNGHPDYDPEGVMLKHNLAAWGCRGEDECDDDQKQLLRINIYGMVSLALVLIMTLFALPFFRRKKFEWFYYVHHLFILVLVFVCLHYPGALIYLIPGVSIYTIDKLMGLLANLKTGLANTKMVSSDVLEVSVKLGKDTTYKAGQYVFVNVPEVSHLEWHPYSITSSPNANPSELFFHLKALGGPDSWTRKVVEAAGQGCNLPMRIDGFYGDYGEELKDKNAVVLVGGGIGVTPMIGIGLDLIHMDPKLPVTIMWICRTVNEFEIFSTQLHKAVQRHPNITVKAWITLSHPEPIREMSSQINKPLVNDLSAEEACDKVISLLKAPIPDEKTATGDKDVSSCRGSSRKDHAFVMDRPGLDPLVNATGMLLAMILALTGYTTSVDISNRKEVEPEEKVVILSQSLIMSLVLLTFVLIRLARPILKLAKTKPSEGSGDNEKNMFRDDIDELDASLEPPAQFSAATGISESYAIDVDSFIHQPNKPPPHYSSDSMESTDPDVTDSVSSGDKAKSPEDTDSDGPEEAEELFPHPPPLIEDSISYEIDEDTLQHYESKPVPPCQPPVVSHELGTDDFIDSEKEGSTMSLDSIISDIKNDMIFQSMLKGRIGCRPDLEAEFRELAKKISNDIKGPADIGVLACGPQAMTQAINKAVVRCNNEDGLFTPCLSTEGVGDGDSTKAYFAFVEEDWDW